MIVITYTPTYCHVKCNLVEKRYIKRLVSARPDGFQFSPKFKKGWWDGYVTLLDKANRFPAGLLNYVMDNLEIDRYDFDVVGFDEVIHSFAEPDITGYAFRPYQLEAVRRVHKYQRGVLKMATNAGKTLVTAGIVQTTGYSAIIIVPTVPLIQQTVEELSSMLNIEIGQYGGGRKHYSDVTVTTTASLGALIAECDLSNNRTLIIDECHHTKSDQVFEQVFSIPAEFRIGMSGTPMTNERLSDLKLIGATGDVIYEIKNAELIDAGYSSKPVIKFVKVEEPHIKSKTDYQTVYRLGVVDNLMRNTRIARIADQERQRGPVLVICNWVEHVNNITSLDGSFISATGTTPKSDLNALLDQFEVSKDVLVVSPIFGEGVNIPSVATIIMASGNKSHIRVLQNIGRGLRKTADKSVVHIYDFIDTTHKYLSKHSEERYKLYKDEGFVMEMAS